MTAYREVWIECDGCDRPFGREGGYLTQFAVVADARDCGWMPRSEPRPAGWWNESHYCPDCRDKP